MGPGMFIGYRLVRGGEMLIHPQKQYPALLDDFLSRFERTLDDMPSNYATASHTVSRVANEMFAEAGVKTVWSACVADPIVKNGRVGGFFIEAKSGRLAVKAKVTIDATGDGELAARAGAPMKRRVSAAEVDSPNVNPTRRRPDYKGHNEGKIYLLIANADIAKYDRFWKRSAPHTEQDLRWVIDHLTGEGYGWPLYPILRKAWESGEFRIVRKLRHNLYVSLQNWFEQVAPGLAGGRAEVWGDYDNGDWRDVALIETAVRDMAFDGIRFFRKHVPGFEDAFILATSSFLGARGGTCIDGEVMLRPQDTWRGVLYPDTLYRTFCEVGRGADPRGHDMPYRMLLPRKVDGLLVVGRGSAYLRRGHDPSTRARTNMMAQGHAAGIAAAFTVRDKTPLRKVDIKKVQRTMLREGYFLGDSERLRELGLGRGR
jgi:hypothetical protein